MNEMPTSPLLQNHIDVGAQLTDFASWQLPLRFTSELAEHKAVRRSAGIFDLSHMGQVEVIGPDAAEVLDRCLIGQVSHLAIGRAKYSMMLAKDGGILDDLILYRVAPTEFLVVLNGINRVRVVDALMQQSQEYSVGVTDQTLCRGLIAIQGPESARVLESMAASDLSELKYYRSMITRFMIDGLAIPVFLSRTGYTGEDGFEISVSSNDAPKVWQALANVDGVVRCGLAARDSLRIEAGMPLYGNELTPARTPYDVSMGHLVQTEHDFEGRDALHRRTKSSNSALIGLRGEGRRAARAESQVYLERAQIGIVTSGMLSPTLGHPIALAIVNQELPVGTTVDVDVRGRNLPMTVVDLPFYQRSSR